MMLRLGLLRLSLSFSAARRRLIGIASNFRPSGSTSLTTADGKIFRAREE